MASDTSSPSHTPMVLTPDSTGTPTEGSAVGAAGEERKAKRRQTAFYPNNLSGPNKPPPKPFSRSAAKRQSVLALGSIEHLQYYFTKTGIQASKNPHVTKGLVPALGGLTINTSTEQDLSVPRVVQLPPTPVAPEPKIPTFPPYVKSYETDPATLLPGVVEDLASVAHVWRDTENDDTFQESKELVDILRILKTTTRMIRSVRNYILALPAEQFTMFTPAAFRRMDSNHHQPTPPRSPANFSGDASGQHGQHTRDSSSGESEGQRRIRRAALNTLSVLRDLEERSRIAREDESQHGSPAQRSSSLTLDPHPGAPPSPTSMRALSPPNLSSSPTTQSHISTSTYSVPVWSDDESDDGIWNMAAEVGEEKEGWDARLSRIEESGGFLYRHDIPLGSLQKERHTVKAYLEVVDNVVFGGPADTNDGETERGWVRERKRAHDKERKQKSRQRRTSAGDTESRGRAFGAASGSSRRISLPARLLSDTELSEEPLGEDGEGMANIQEVDEEEAQHNGHRQGSLDEDDDDLPDWAKRDTFMDSELERAHSLLSYLLPPNLNQSLASPSDGKEAFLRSLTSGQLLCVAYNAGVRRSKKPWGYVNKEGIHDIITLEKQGEEAEDRKKSWTFRRIENLRFWVGALGLRYTLPISQPAQALPMAPTSNRSSSIRPGRTASPAPSRSSRLSTGGSPRGRSSSRGPENAVLFDAKIVASQSEGWVDMLETVLGMWVSAVVREERMSGRS